MKIEIEIFDKKDAKKAFREVQSMMSQMTSESGAIFNVNDHPIEIEYTSSSPRSWNLKRIGVFSISGSGN